MAAVVVGKVTAQIIVKVATAVSRVTCLGSVVHPRPPMEVRKAAKAQARAVVLETKLPEKVRDSFKEIVTNAANGDTDQPSVDPEVKAVVSTR